MLRMTIFAVAVSMILPIVDATADYGSSGGVSDQQASYGSAGGTSLPSASYGSSGGLYVPSLQPTYGSDGGSVTSRTRVTDRIRSRLHNARATRIHFGSHSYGSHGG